MKKKMLAILMAALMLRVMAVVPVVADTVASVPVGTDFFLDKNPGLETEITDHQDDWKKIERLQHDTNATGYKEEFGDYYYHIDANNDLPGGQLPVFKGLEGGRHYSLSFYVRNAGRREAILVYYFLKKNENGAYTSYAGMDIDNKWKDGAGYSQFVGLNDGATNTWTKLTYDIVLPPNADGVRLEMCYDENKCVTVADFDADNFSLTAGEYLSDNILRNGSFDAIRGAGDPIYWDYDKIQSGSNTVDDGNGGYYFDIKKQGALIQGQVYLAGGKQYKVTFKFRSNNGIRPSGIGIDGVYYCSVDTVEDVGVRNTHNDGWEQFTAYFTAPGTVGEYSGHTFGIGYAPEGVYGNLGVGIDDVVLTEAEDTAVSYVKDVPGKFFYETGYDIYFQNPYVDTANGILWWRGTEEDAITDFAAIDGVHPVAVYAYRFPKVAGEKVSLISAVYKENNGAKQLVNVMVTTVTAADTNPVALTHTVDVKETDAASAQVKSFIWTDVTKLAPIANSVYTLGK